MSKVAIIAESSCNLPPPLVEAHDIHIMPLRLSWRGESLRDGIDITAEEVYQRQEQEDYTPKTSSISPGELVELINGIIDQVEAVVAIMLSGKLSSSVGVARLVQEMRPDLPLHVIDSRTAAMAQGFVVLEAARVAQAGARVEAVIARAKEIVGKVHLIAALETLKYLHRMGRVVASVAQIGEALHIRPVISIPPGHGAVVSQVRPRTWQKALDYLIESMAARAGDRCVHVAVSHANRQEAAEYVADEVRRRFKPREFYLNALTPVMGAAAGPAVAVTFYTDDEVR